MTVEEFQHICLTHFVNLTTDGQLVCATCLAQDGSRILWPCEPRVAADIAILTEMGALPTS